MAADSLGIYFNSNPFGIKSVLQSMRRTECSTKVIKLDEVQRLYKKLLLSAPMSKEEIEEIVNSNKSDLNHCFRVNITLQTTYYVMN